MLAGELKDTVMRPLDIVVIWPTPDEIARAVFAAAKLEGEDPIDVFQGVGGARSRAYAFIALAHQFPTVPRAELARKCGNASAGPGVRKALLAAAWPWFSLDRLNAVRAALGWTPMTLDDAISAPMIYCGRSWTEFLPKAAAPARTIDIPPAAPTVPKAAASDAQSTPSIIKSTLPAPPQAARIPAPDAAASMPAVHVATKTPVISEPAPRVAPTPPASALIAPARAEPTRKTCAPAQDLRPAPAPLKPSPAAIALASATAVMRAPKAKLTGALAPRIIDHRPSGVVDLGEPLPGRSALDQRRIGTA